MLGIKLCPGLGITPFLQFYLGLSSSLTVCGGSRSLALLSYTTLTLQPSLIREKLAIRRNTDGVRNLRDQRQPLLVQDWSHQSQLSFPSKSFIKIICCSRAGTAEFPKTLHLSMAGLVLFTCFHPRDPARRLAHGEYPITCLSQNLVSDMLLNLLAVPVVGSTFPFRSCLISRESKHHLQASPCVCNFEKSN